VDHKFFALDNDLYKFTMQQAVLHNYPDVNVVYKFRIRNADKKILYDDPLSVNDIFKKVFAKGLNEKIDAFCETKFDREELSYLRTIPFIKSDYVDFLEDFTFKRRYIRIGPDLTITIRGPWLQTILFEVPLLSILSELYCDEILSCRTKCLRETLKSPQYIYPNEFMNKEKMDDFRFSDFGTRRRSSHDFHSEIIRYFKMNAGKHFVGTSNVHFAKKYKVKAIGTMAHEWLQAHQALTRVSDSQKKALEVWAKEYRGDLGIALSDVVGFNAFLRDFDKYFAKLFDGCRHDSGNPFEWGDKLIKHYKSLKIEPETKTAIFSDGLDFEFAKLIYLHFHGRIKCGFGIGTYLSNFLSNPPSIVIKMVECNNKPVAKISDSNGKLMCDDEDYLSYLRNVFHI